MLKTILGLFAIGMVAATLAGCHASADIEKPGSSFQGPALSR